MTQRPTDQVVWAVRRTTLARGAARLWRLWQDAGLPLLAAYWSGVGAVLVYGLWEGYRRPDLTLPVWSMGSGVALLWVLAVSVRHQPLWTHITDEVLLRAPLPPITVLRWPLLRALLAPLAWGLGLGLLIGLLLPQGRWLAVSLPFGLMGAVVLQSWSAAARPSGDPRTKAVLYLLALLPLLAVPAAPLLPIVTLAGWVGGWLGWHWQWRQGVDARSRLDLQYQGIRQGARQLGLPAPTQHPDIPPRHSRIRPQLRGTGALAACSWRSLLHVLTHFWRVLPALALGPALLPLFSGAPDPAPGSPLWSSIVLASALPLLGPAAPPGFPISVSLHRLSRLWPAALLFSVLSTSSGMLTVWWSGGSWLLVPVALLAPWVTLANAEWLETNGWLSPDQAVQSRFAVAMLPGIVVFFCAYFGWPGAAPLLLFGGGVALLMRR